MTSEMQAKREQLKALSKVAKMLVSSGACGTINEALIDIYRNDGHEEIHSFKKWIERGFCVRRGEKALLLWGEPRKGGKQEKEAEGEEDEFKFFPLAYVFSNKQVDPM